MCSIKELFDWQQAKEAKDDHYMPSKDIRTVGTKFIVDKLVSDNDEDVAGLHGDEILTLVDDVDGVYREHVGMFKVDRDPAFHVGLFWREVSPYVEEAANGETFRS